MTTPRVSMIELPYDRSPRFEGTVSRKFPTVNSDVGNFGLDVDRVKNNRETFLAK